MKHIYNIGDKVARFEVKKVTEVPEQNAVMYEFSHTECGARLLYLATGDSNKLFSVTFKTVPDNNTGVFHILEHSVLNGSAKYPVREPFVELIKSSMNTFLNAMTFPDKTMYPVSSRNEKDFLNLTEVYLDAVFKPNIYTNPSIFRQEGWHYEFDEDGKAFVNGVVFNEMKGVESSVDERINEAVMSHVFPDNCYSKNSGGYSPEIPQLSYEDFIAYHQKFYSPDNAIFYLEGDVNIEKPVALMEEYLDRTGADLSCTDIPMQAPVASTTEYIEYPIAEEEDDSDKTHIAMARILCTFKDKEKLCAASIISDYLTGSLESPLTAKILTSGLGQDVHFSIENCVMQPYYYLQVSNTEKEKLGDIRKAIRELVDDIKANGLNREDLEATISHMEFSCRETSEPRALYHNMSVMNSYLYGGDACQSLTYNDMFAFLREKLDTSYYTDLLCEMLSEDGLVTVVASPSKTLAEKEAGEEAERNAAAQNAWSEDEEKEKKEIYAVMTDWQKTPDTKEALDTMPKLSISDVDEKPEEIVTKTSALGNAALLLHPTAVSEVGYINLYFPVPKKYENSLPNLSLVANLFKNVPTEKHDVLSLNREIKKTLGSLSFELTPYAKAGETKAATTYFAVHASVLKSKAKEAAELISEIILESKFNTPDMVKNLFLQILDSFRNEIIESGHSIGVRRASAPLSVRASIIEGLEGLECYESLKTLCADFSGLDEYIAFAEGAARDIFTKDGLIVSLTASAKDVDDTEGGGYSLASLVNSFPDGEKKDAVMTRKLEKEGLVAAPIPAQVSYACAAMNLDEIGQKYTGAWAVAANIATYQYLWNKVRVQGGAYGVGMRASRNGDVVFYSYRDPSGMQSYEVYSTVAAFLRDYANSDEEIEKFIISTISSGDPLLTPRSYGSLGDTLYLTGVSYEDRCANRSEMLKLKKEDLIAVADTLEKLEEYKCRAIVGTLPDGTKTDKTIML